MTISDVRVVAIYVFVLVGLMAILWHRQQKQREESLVIIERMANLILQREDESAVNREIAAACAAELAELKATLNQYEKTPRSR